MSPNGQTALSLLNAVYEKVREGGQVKSRAVVLAIGVTASGHRQVLGIEVGNTESEAFWRDFLRSLVRRGLKGVELAISDAHVGIRLRFLENKDRAVIHPPIRPPAPAGRARGRSPAATEPIERPRVEYRLNGSLGVRIDQETQYDPLRDGWSDGPDAPIEGALNRVVEGLVAMADAVRKRRREAEEYERRRQAEERRQRAAAQRAAEEEARIADLAKRAVAWRQADEMAAFIAEVEHAARKQGKLSGSRTPHARWLAWAHEHVAAVRQGAFRAFPAGLPHEPEEAAADQPSTVPAPPQAPQPQ